jgi:ABC-type lipoprotein release transport system permease subunit
MYILRMIFKEVWHRKINFLLAVLAVTTAAAFLVAFFTASKASERETARLMLSMGYNLHIIAKDADIGGFLMTGIPDKTMPEAYLGSRPERHLLQPLLALLEGKTSYRGMDILLTGLAPEVCPPGQQKQAMTFSVAPGTAYVGYRLAEGLAIHKGDTIDMAGKKLKVERCLAESGGLDDMRLQCSLQDAREILGLGGSARSRPSVPVLRRRAIRGRCCEKSARFCRRHRSFRSRRWPARGRSRGK